MGACGQATSQCCEATNEAIFERNCDFSEVNYEEICQKLFEDEKNNEIDFTQLYNNKNDDEEIKAKIVLREKEKEESKKFVEENLDEIKTKFDSIMQENIEKDYLIDIELNKPEKQQERIENIQKISDNIFEEKTREEFIEQIMDLTENVKASVCYEIYHEPEKFFKKDEIKNDSSSDLFIQGALSSFLEQKGVHNVIRKNSNNENTSTMALQLIFNGNAFNQIINFHLSYGENNDQVILNDPIEQARFIQNKKKNYARILGKNEDDIIISKIREGTEDFDTLVKNSTSGISNEEISELKKYEESIGAKFVDINKKCLLSFCQIHPGMFDQIGDQLYDGMERNGKRGPPGYLMDYDPPIGYKGYGLKVTGKYDNGNDTWLGYTNQVGEWYIAYHGTSGQYAKNILEDGLKKGDAQVHRNYKNINPLTKDKFPIVGEGVYCSPKISEADYYAKGKEIIFDNKKFRFVFMLRVNPYKIRISEGKPDYWVFEGDYLGDNTKRKFDDEVRPYRILLKEINGDNENNFLN